jgi:hypothetical protein
LASSSSSAPPILIFRSVRSRLLIGDILLMAVGFNEVFRWRKNLNLLKKALSEKRPRPVKTPKKSWEYNPITLDHGRVSTENITHPMFDNIHRNHGLNPRNGTWMRLSIGQWDALNPGATSTWPPSHERYWKNLFLYQRSGATIFKYLYWYLPDK